MTSKEKLMKPKELSRLVDIMYQRQTEHRVWVKKVKAVVFLLRIAIWLIPNAKKGYKSAIKNANLDNLILHWEDIYWSVYKKDYDFAGMTWKQRVELVKEKGWKLPNTMI